MRDDLPSFYSWETPDLMISVKPSGYLTDYADVVVSIQQGSRFVNFHKEDLEISEDTIYLTMPQEISGKFVGDKVANVQVNILYNNGRRKPTNWKQVWIKPNLCRRPIEGAELNWSPAENIINSVELTSDDFDVNLEMDLSTSGGGGSDDYNQLRNKPSIEGNLLVGNKTFPQLGLDTLSVQEIEKILYID